MENEWKIIIATEHFPCELSITYDDLPGLWGGSIFTIRGDCSLEQQTKVVGAATAEMPQKKISKPELVECRVVGSSCQAWEPE